MRDEWDTVVLSMILNQGDRDKAFCFDKVTSDSLRMKHNGLDIEVA